MGENTAIEWCDHTFNPWIGCTKISPACANCYAEAYDNRYGGGHWGSGAQRRMTKTWNAPLRWDRDAAAKGARPWVFCASLADVFDNEVPVEWRVALWDLVRQCRNLRWIFVTKRIGNAAKMLPCDWAENFGHCGLVATIASQDEFDRDAPKLMVTPASWRGLSMEPLLGPTDIAQYTTIMSSFANYCDAVGGPSPKLMMLDWVIVGGESGPKARPIDPVWVRGIRDQCAEAGVPFFFKQWGEWEADALRYTDALTGECPPKTAKIGKKRAGRMLDGRTHDQMPRITP